MQKTESTNRTGYSNFAIPPRSNAQASSLTSRRQNVSLSSSSSLHARDQQTRSHGAHTVSSSNPFKQKSKTNFPSFESAFQNTTIKSSSSLLFMNESFEEDSFFIENISHCVLDLSTDEKWTIHAVERDSHSPLREEDHDHSLLDQTADSFFNSSRVECLITPEKRKMVSPSNNNPTVGRGNTSMYTTYLDTSSMSSRSHNTSSNSLQTTRQSMGSTVKDALDVDDVECDSSMIRMFQRAVTVQQTETSVTHHDLDDEDEPSFLKDGSSSPWLDKNRWKGVSPTKVKHSPFDGTFCLEESILIFNHESPDKIMNTSFKDQSCMLEDAWAEYCSHDKSIELMQDSSPSDKSRNSFELDMSRFVTVKGRETMDDEGDITQTNSHVSTCTPKIQGIQSLPSSTIHQHHSIDQSPLLMASNQPSAAAHTHPSYLLKDIRNKYLKSELLRLSKDLFVKATMGSCVGVNDTDYNREDHDISNKEGLRHPLSELASKYMNRLIPKNPPSSTSPRKLSLDLESVLPVDRVRTSMKSIPDKENENGYKLTDPEDSPESYERYSVDRMLCHWRT